MFSDPLFTNKDVMAVISIAAFALFCSYIIYNFGSTIKEWFAKRKQTQKSDVIDNKMDMAMKLLIAIGIIIFVFVIVLGILQGKLDKNTTSVSNLSTNIKSISYKINEMDKTIDGLEQRVKELETSMIELERQHQYGKEDNK